MALHLHKSHLRLPQNANEGWRRPVCTEVCGACWGSLSHWYRQTFNPSLWQQRKMVSPQVKICAMCCATAVMGCADHHRGCCVLFFIFHINLILMVFSAFWVTQMYIWCLHTYCCVLSPFPCPQQHKGILFTTDHYVNLNSGNIF